jgi:hypothetical protein
MIITIASSDKISIAMFLSFLRKNLGANTLLGEIHYLMTPEETEKYIEGILSNKSSKVVFTYYVKKRYGTVPPKSVPEKLMSISNAVVWFDLYGTQYTLLKDDMNFDNLFKDTWEKSVKQLSQR